MSSARRSPNQGASEKIGRNEKESDAREIDEFFTISEVAEQLIVHDRSVRRWIKSRKLAAHRFGSVVRIARDDLDDFLKAHRS